VLKYALASLKCAAATSVLLDSGMAVPMAMDMSVIPHGSHPAVPSCLHTGLQHQFEALCATCMSSQLLVQSTCPASRRRGHRWGWALPASGVCLRLTGSHPFAFSHQLWIEFLLGMSIPSQNVIVFTSLNESHQFCLLFQEVFACLVLCSYCLCCRRDKAIALFSVTAIYIF